MAVRGTEIVKKLPELGKKNCRECGFPTCFAYAMKLASAGTTVDKCAYLTPEVKAELEEALAPPIKLVTIGDGPNALKIGNEEVIYRHEKTFVHPPGIALLISDKETDAVIDAKLKRFKELRFSWVGLTLHADLLAVRYDSGDRSRYRSVAKKVCEAAQVGLVLISEDLEAMFNARDACAAHRPLLYPITEKNIEAAIPRIKARPTPVAVRAGSVAGLVALTNRLKAAGIDDLVLDPGSNSLAQAMKDQLFIRRAALKQGFRPLGYPTIAFPYLLAKDRAREYMAAAMFVAKWAGLIVLSDMDKASLLPLLVQRLNIYTDPRIPMSVEEKIYEVGEPTADSPVLLTSNWALTYFIVAAATEGSKVPAWLCVKETEGLGVLTAWAAGKFGGDNVAAFIKKSGIANKVKHRKLIIPGTVARIRGELEDELPGWEIIVGPRDCNAIPGYLPDLVKGWKA